MKILVCIKQVPDLESRFKLNAAGTWYSEQDLAWRMNEYDEYAVEQAVQLKEQSGGELVVLSLGPERVREALKKALAMGADRGVHLQDDASFAKDPSQIAAAIAAYAKDEQFDVVFTGLQSQDRGSAQVGVLLAAALGLNAVTTIVDFSLAGSVATVKRELEGGVKAVVEVTLPALFTCQLGLNTPRYPTLPNIMKAKKKEIAALPVSVPEGRTTTLKTAYPEKKGGGLVLEGEVGALADQLLALLKEKTAVLR
ncbi:electron transfer flavoprotein subunit beta/FixA family protein [Desulfuromonas carbonis]|uniref:electron transfer flavoprotein subunit beta/FixA family protein n=1 Tax=Desulfuromonas sp. DDH964 TaxID=1823759 RepID=UPI00078B8236|nr:electron transfer flavoprotein subunit beta/FixA family protein [Desulfuromonas sp. DDH964]AMV70852.1 electron transfer flavoprotein subunit beta [Desulfuromonas sp. DDH964]